MIPLWQWDKKNTEDVKFSPLNRSIDTNGYSKSFPVNVDMFNHLFDDKNLKMIDIVVSVPLCIND